MQMATKKSGAEEDLKSLPMAELQAKLGSSPDGLSASAALVGNRHESIGDSSRGIRLVHDPHRVEMGASDLGLCAGVVPCQRPGETCCVPNFRLDPRPIVG
jgi:hypothetical protein